MTLVIYIPATVFYLPILVIELHVMVMHLQRSLMLVVPKKCAFTAMNSEPTKQPTAETKAKRRIWKKTEEDALIRCMRNEYSDKWTADNGFKAGFFTLIEKELTKLLPNTDIRANPHIDSKVKYWKTTYNLITDILRVSGFYWSDVNKCIVVDEASVWEDYEKVKSNILSYILRCGISYTYYVTSNVFVGP